MDSMKKCTKCKTDKPLTEFHRASSYVDGRHKWCKSCRLGYYQDNLDEMRKKARKCVSKHKESRRDSKFKSRYGITLSEYNKKREEQNYKCGICETHEDNLKTRLFVDHNHDTEQVRMLLCQNCNTGIGQFKESIVRLDAAINYLKKFNKQA